MVGAVCGFRCVWLWRLVVLLLIALPGLWPRTAVAQAAAPAVCTIGVSVESLYDLDMAGESFGATLWVWTICPASLPRQPLETIEFLTAGSLLREPVETMALGDGRVYASRRVQGSFRFNWKMDAYPFDRQVVVIPIQDAEYGATHLQFAPDTAQSFLSRDVAGTLREWNVSDLTLGTRVVEAESAYGVPGSATTPYALAEATFTLERTSLGPFLKLTSGVLAAAFIAFFSFFYNPNEGGTFGSKVGLIVGILFAVIVNMRAADSALGDTGDMTLVTQIHLVTLLLLVILALTALRDRLRLEAGDTLPHPHWRRLAVIGTGYVLIVGALVVRAALS